MKTIVLTNDNKAKCWTAAELINGKPSSELINMFGTHVLPTPFTNEAPVQLVVNEISALNPGAEIMVAGQQSQAQSLMNRGGK